MDTAIVKLTGIKTQKIKAAVIALEADWTKYNDIWSSVLYPIGEYYLLPFFPIIYSSPYNVIDRLLFKGGFNLDDRGVLFEKYLYNKLTHTANSYPAICMPAGRYGIHGDEEEIDMLISMKKVIIIADAKCIHYSVEPLNYSEAWSRLEEGCEQVIRKAEFVKNNPQYFEELGDYTSKEIIPFVITNYPTFTGFPHNGVFIIDSHSFLSYMKSGIMTMRQLSFDGSSILGMKKFYNSEEQFSDNFKKFLSDNPIKHEFLKRIYIHDLPLAVGCDPWHIIGKSAQVRNDPQFNISNNS